MPRGRAHAPDGQVPGTPAPHLSVHRQVHLPEHRLPPRVGVQGLQPEGVARVAKPGIAICERARSSHWNAWSLSPRQACRLAQVLGRWRQMLASRPRQRSRAPHRSLRRARGWPARASGRRHVERSPSAVAPRRRARPGARGWPIPDGRAVAGSDLQRAPEGVPGLLRLRRRRRRAHLVPPRRGQRVECHREGSRS